MTKGTVLQECFNPTNPARGGDMITIYGALTHCHLVLVLLAYLTGAKFDIKDDQGNFKYPCNSQGFLSSSAVAADVLHKLLRQGLKMEILSWRITVEEPGGCQLISNAMNMPHAAALRNTELQAMSYLNGEIMLHLDPVVTGRVLYDSLKRAARPTLGEIVDDPEFKELVDCVCQLGATNSYISELLEWTTRFVSSQHRRLRLAAVAAVNEMNSGPRTKIAVIMRALWKPPQNTMCPVPEPAWKTMGPDDFLDLENLLNYCYETCLPAVAVMSPKDKMRVLGCCSIGAAEAFISVPNKQDKSHKNERREKMLNATAKHVEHIRKTWCDLTGKNKDQFCLVPNGCEWMKFDTALTQQAAAEDAKAKAAGAKAPELPMMPAIIDWKQAARDGAESARSSGDRLQVPTIAPVKEWYQLQEVTERSSRIEQECCAKVVLAELHKETNYAESGLDVWYDPKARRHYVKTTKEMARNQIRLFPSLPRNGRLSDDKASTMSLPIRVTKYTPTNADIPQPAPDPLRVFHITPEFVAPKEEYEPHARAADTGLPDPSPQSRCFAWSGKESMNPIGAVLRLTEEELAKDKLVNEFNCDWGAHALRVALLGRLFEGHAKFALQVEVPYLTNSFDLPKGAILVCRKDAVAKQPQKSVNKSWKKEVEPTAKKQKKDEQRAMEGMEGVSPLDAPQLRHTGHE